MIRSRRRASLALALLGTLAMAPAMASVGSELIGSAHDFVRGTGGADESRVCVFCHTPYGARESPLGPLWQRGVQPEFAFPAYATRDDPLAARSIGFDVAGMSVVCLSCHDSGQAPTVTSLANEHPFGVPYRGLRDGTFVPPVGQGGFRRPNSALIDGRLVWWASLQPPGSRRTRHDLPLYLRREGALDDESPYVECGTCHDPHSTSAQFLRAPRENSVLCLTCHLL